MGAKLDKKGLQSQETEATHRLSKGKKTKTQRLAYINEKPLGFLSTEDVFNW